MKIAVYPVKNDWAFGQIFRAVKKYSSHEIDLFNREDDIRLLENYDLIHIPTLINNVRFLKEYPEFVGRTCVSIHGKAELYNYNPITDTKQLTSREEIESGILHQDVIEYINGLGKIACVSDELVNLLKKNTKAEVFKLPCGGDVDLFGGELPEHKILTVICPMPKNYMDNMASVVHRYNVKRYDLILEVEKRLPHIKFVYPERLLSIDEIADFYKTGDIIINLSHSEGNPLGVIEAGIRGVVPLTTVVGIIPELIIDGVNGIYVKNDAIVENAVSALNYLYDHPEKVLELKKNIKSTILKKREWSKVIKSWDDYFTAVRKTKVAVCIATREDRKGLFRELLISLNKQTYKNFRVYAYHGKGILGKVKSEAVNLALKDNPEYICMLDDDDLIHPTYLEKVIGRLEKGDIDWCYTWGSLFQERTGYIHGEFQTPAEIMEVNHQPAWISAKASVFKLENFDPSVSFAEDRDLWVRLYGRKFRGDIIREELYYRRWHENSNTVKISKKDSDVKEKSNITIIPNKYKETFRFHLASLVHLPQSKEYMSCAFTQKNRKLAKMLTSLGHEVFFYGAEGSDVEEYCDSDKLHFIETHTLRDIATDWGDGDNRFEIGYDWHSTDFRHDFSSDKKPSTLKAYAKITEHINTIKFPDDFFLNTMGYYWKPVEDAVGLFLSCESGIGYRGSYKGHYRAFESAYIRDFTYGSENPFQDINGSYYDRVIPNYFDPADFEYREKKDDYYLYIGRMIRRKGILTAAMACNAIGKKLLIAGQGASVRDNGHLVPNTNPDFDLEAGTWEYVGYAGVEKRKKLMAGAIAAFVPTEYQECFGGTHIEAMLSGTPPITTNFGVFNGTLGDYVDGKLGFRCNTLEDFSRAALAATDVNHKEIRAFGERYLMDKVKMDYHKWFTDLYHLYLSATMAGELAWSRIPEDIHPA